MVHTDSPFAHKGGYASVCEAAGGFRFVNGNVGEPPVRPNISMGDTLAATNPGVEGACSESDDRRAVCTCGKSGGQKFGAFFVGDTIQGYVNRSLKGWK